MLRVPPILAANVRTTSTSESSLAPIRDSVTDAYFQPSPISQWLDTGSERLRDETGQISQCGLS